MQIEYRGNQPLSFSGRAIAKVSLVTGINDVEVGIVKYLLNTDYFKSLVEAETIIIREALPVETATETPAKRTRKSVEFTEEE
jgi:hypothetical protein